MKRSEIEAIRQLKQGDVRGLKTLVNAHQTKALRVAYLITGSSALAEECVQDAFIQVYQHIEQFDDRRPFAPWFLRIVSNNAIKTGRREQRCVSFNDSANDAEALLIAGLTEWRRNLDEQVAEKITREEIWALLEKLSPTQREAIVSRYYLDMSEAEMAERLETAPGTIKWRLYAARQRLQKLITGSDLIKEVKS
ncbi:MAG: RNA polymerase sigma factor [Anaerolineales bacterium]|nr:RNA polymerase sigma factor [Anaerolineales bacterium]